MSCVKSAFDSIVQRIKDKTILNIKPKEQKKKRSKILKKKEFTEKIIQEFSKKKLN